MPKSAFLQHRRLEVAGMRRADAGVDIDAIGIVTDRHHLRAEFVEHGWRDVISRAMRAIDDELQTLQIELVRECALQNSM